MLADRERNLWTGSKITRVVTGSEYYHWRFSAKS
jgi:hypothetical protein